MASDQDLRRWLEHIAREAPEGALRVAAQQVLAGEPPPLPWALDRPLRVILESPYAGDVTRNESYARRALRDSLLRGEAPIASHLLYTQPGVLNDTVPVERALGIEAGLAWLDVADATVVYMDLGISRGMELGIERARAARRPVYRRTIGHEP